MNGLLVLAGRALSAKRELSRIGALRGKNHPHERLLWQ
jgi:hypothetical protein